MEHRAKNIHKDSSLETMLEIGWSSVYDWPRDPKKEAGKAARAGPMAKLRFGSYEVTCIGNECSDDLDG